MKTPRMDGHLRQTLDSLPVMVCALNPHGTIVFWNRECERVTGYHANEIVGNLAAMEALSPAPEQREEVLAEWKRPGDEGHKWRWKITCKDGSVRLVLWSNASESLAVPGWAMWGVGVDVTAQALSPTPLRDARTEPEPSTEPRTTNIRTSKRRPRAEAGAPSRSSDAERQAQRQFEDIIDNASATIVLKDLEGRYLLANRRAAWLVHKTKEQLVGKTDYDILPKATADLFRANDRKAIESKVPFETEDVVVIDGAPYTYLTLKFPLRNEDGEPYAVCTIATDITKRQRSEERLRLLSGAVEQSTEGIGVTDLDGTFLFVNNALARMHGYMADELVGKPFFVLHTDDQVAPARAARQTVLEKGRYDGELWHTRRDGSVFPVSLHDTLLRDDAGNPIGEIITVRDISDQRRALQQAHDSEKRFRQMAENINQVFWLNNAKDGQELYVSPAYEEIWGRSCESAYSDPRAWLEAVHPEDRPRILAAFERQARGEGTDEEYRIIRPDGTIRWIHNHCVPIRNEAGNVYRTAGIAEDITARKRAEELLRASEENYRRLFDYHPAACFAYDRDGVIRIWNREAQRVYGYKPEEIIGRKIVETIASSAEDRAATETMVARVFTGEFVSELEWADRTADGDTRWVLTNTFPIHNEKGEVILGISSNIDITERKRAEEALRNSEARTRAIVNAAADAIITADERGTIESFNPAASRIFGYAPEEIIGKNLRTLMPEPYAAHHDQYMTNYAQTGVAKIIGIGREVVARRRDGAIFPIDLSVAEVRIGDQRVFTGIIRDITDRKRAEQALRESEERNRTILDQMQEAVIFADATDTIRHINACACSLLNTTREQVVGQDLLSVHEEAVRSKVAEIVETFRQGTCHHVITVRRTLGDREVILRFSPVRGIEGDYWGIITNIVDITEQVRMQQHLADARRMEAVGTLAGGVAHDFNNLMATVLGCASHLRRRRRPDHPDYESLTQIEQAADTAGRLAHQLLIYAKGGKILPRIVRFADVIDRAIQVFKPALPVSVRLDCQIAADLAEVECDTTQVEQVIVNLCRNGVDAMPGGGRLTVRAANETLATPLEDSHPPLAAGEYVCITVEDTGSGMSPETAKRVFDPFFTTKPNGYGLGLAAAYGTVKSHGGAISLTTTVGAGTAFHVRLPRAPRAE